MTDRFSPTEKAEMTALLRQTNHRAAIVQRGIDAGLTYEQIADRDGVSLARVRDFSTWERVLAGVIPKTTHDAYYCNVYVGYIWGLAMSPELRPKLFAYRQELAKVDPTIDPDRITPDNRLKNRASTTKGRKHSGPQQI